MDNQKNIITIGKRLEGKKMILTQTQMNEVEREFWRRTNFVPHNIIKYLDRTFAIDQQNKRYYFTPFLGKHDFRINYINEILEIELSENNNTIVKSSGGTGGAIVGGLLGGPTGAIIGSTFKNTNSSTRVDSLCINIITTDRRNPYVKLDFIKTFEERNKYYKARFDIVHSIFSSLKSALHAQQSNKTNVPAGDKNLISQLKDLSALHDSGKITDEEFILAKQKLLK